MVNCFSYILYFECQTYLRPNYRKVAIVLEELGLDYGNVYYDLATNVQKTEEFLKYNPNGRIPALIDHQNNDFVIWFVLQYVLCSEHWC